MDNPCYYCGAPATTREHVPAKCIFPKPKDAPEGRDYRNNMIVVPSCDQHNLAKSRDDEYLLYVLAMSLPSNEVAASRFQTTILRAVGRRPQLLDALLIERYNVTVHDTERDEWHQTIAIKPNEARLTSIFNHIAHGIYFHETRNVWQGETRILIEFLVSLTDVTHNEATSALARHADDLFAAVPPKGSNPDIFSYHFDAHDGAAIIRMNFFGNSKVSAALTPPGRSFGANP